MRKGPRFGLAVVLALGWVAPASAGSLASASLSFTIGLLPTVAFPATGATGTATSALAASLAGGSAFDATVTTPAPTSAAPVTQLQVKITGNAAGSFVGATPDSVGGQAVFQGVANVLGFGGMTLLSIPIQMGAPGAAILPAPGGLFVTAIASSWTAGMATLTGIGSTAGTTTATGSNDLTAGGGGTLVLVTPLKVISSVGGTFPMAAFGVLTLAFAPEPGALLLLGAGAATLVACGRRRR